MFLSFALACVLGLAPGDARIEAHQPQRRPGGHVRYELEVTLDPVHRTLAVAGTIRFPAAASELREFALNERLTITSATPAVSRAAGPVPRRSPA